MATYAIGDVQGCLRQLLALLHLIDYQPQRDQLWFTGDLVNRGPHSLEVLRFLKNLSKPPVIVLGNHDLHLLAVAYGKKQRKKRDTFDEIFLAPDKEELLTWLRHLPLIHYDEQFKTVMSHAGLAPQWTLSQALAYGLEVKEILRSNDFIDFLENMYGNDPKCWRDDLTGWARLRTITNYLTRMRYCDAKGCLDLELKMPPGSQPKDFMPWFDVKNRMNADVKILFGHWASLNGRADVANVFAIDTGCVWGNHLTAMRLEDGMRFSVPYQLAENVKLWKS